MDKITGEETAPQHLSLDTKWWRMVIFVHWNTGTDWV